MKIVVAFALSIAFGVLVWVLADAWARSSVRKKRAHHYKRRYRKLLREIELVTTVVNELYAYVPAVKNEKVLSYYEGLIKLLETILLAMKEVSPVGTTPYAIESATFLVSDCKVRANKIRGAFKAAAKGKDVDLMALYAKHKEAFADRFCYFCSRPLLPGEKYNVRVKVEGTKIPTTCCKVCREQLQKNKKAKALHLKKDGKAVHWKNVEDYVPSKKYWDINKPKEERKATLELVYSQPANKLPDK